MKPQLLLPLLLAALLPMTASAQSGEGEFPDLFNTSAAYDMLAVFPQADKLAEDPFFTGTLGADTLFLDRAHRIDSVVRPSQLCNLYSLSGGSKDDPEQVVEFFASFDPESLPQKVRGAWIDEICSVRDELSYCLQRLAQAGYAQYWQEQVSPPFLHPCYFGTDVPSNDQLIAAQHSTEEICKMIGADSLGYMEIDYLEGMAGGLPICKACFDGKYPMVIPDENNLQNDFEIHKI